MSVTACLMVLCSQVPAAAAAQREPCVGMYVHQHWAYNHPYAARTWSIDEWRGYLEALRRLGYNTVLVWPVLETMPDPPTPSDLANLDRIARVIEIAHGLEMCLYVALCPNVIANDAEAAKYTFEERPFFATDQRVNPGDPGAMARFIGRRAKLMKPLANADGVFIIDSDPGGYPGSTNQEFAALLAAHRTMLDSLRPDIEIIYWQHVGWRAYCEFYETGELRMGTQDELDDQFRRIVEARIDPWGIATGRPVSLADGVGLSDKVMAFSYGAIEGEPSFPFTNFGGDSAYGAGRRGGPRGTVGNAQTHCLQLPNTFAFVRGAKNLPVTEADYVAFADEVLPGLGQLIVRAWSALAGDDAAAAAGDAAGAMRAARVEIAGLSEDSLRPGPLGGLLLGEPARFVSDLVLQLDARVSLLEFRAAVFAEPPDQAAIKAAFGGFVEAISAWQQRHGYKNNWWWPQMDEALRKLDGAPINAVLATQGYRGKGDTPFEQLQDGFRMTETYVPRLIGAMKQAQAGM